MKLELEYSGALLVERANDTCYFAEDLEVRILRDVDWLESIVRRFEVEAIALAAEGLDRGGIFEPCYDHIAIVGIRLLAHDHEVAIHDAFIPHTLALYAKSEDLFAQVHRLEGEPAFDVLDRKDRLAGLDSSDHGDRVRMPRAADTDRGP